MDHHSRALALFKLSDDVVKVVLSHLVIGDFDEFSAKLNTDHGRALFSMAVRLQLVSRDMRRVVLGVGLFWERVFQVSYRNCPTDMFSGSVVMHRVKQICLLHPALRERCSFEFELHFQEAVGLWCIKEPLEKLSHVERLCASWPLLKGVCHRVWSQLFQRLTSVIVRRNLLSEALSFVRRFHALHPEAFAANTSLVNLLVVRFTRLMMHVLYVEFKRDPNARCEAGGRTALMEAVRLGSVDAIEEFAEGAFAAKPDSRKRKVSSGNPYGVDLNVWCNDGMTMFDHLDNPDSVLGRDRNTVRALLETLR
jgi:hypothetical protein